MTQTRAVGRGGSGLAVLLRLCENLLGCRGSGIGVAGVCLGVGCGQREAGLLALPSGAAAVVTPCAFPCHPLQPPLSRVCRLPLQPSRAPVVAVGRARRLTATPAGLSRRRRVMWPPATACSAGTKTGCETSFALVCCMLPAACRLSPATCCDESDTAALDELCVAHVGMRAGGERVHACVSSRCGPLAPRV